MKISVLVCTRNRADALIKTLDSILETALKSMDRIYELVIVDNNSIDQTASRLSDWLDREWPTNFTATSLLETKPGLATARNKALSIAKGDILVFTDDDCVLSANYFEQLVAYFSGETLPVIRGGRVELGDKRDLPYTIKLDGKRARLDSNMNPSGFINGCNMTMNRAAFERIGLFDERFGAGAQFRSAEDTDYLCRALVAGVLVEYVPDMTVYHFHGRRRLEDIKKLYAGYHFGNGALYAKHLRENPKIIKCFYWDLRGGLRDIFLQRRKSVVGMTLKEIVSGNTSGFISYWQRHLISALTPSKYNDRFS